MNIRFNTISLQGFLSFGDLQVLDLVKGNTSIIGINKTDNYSESNGSGKSALVEAIVWCLTGSTTRGISADKVINENYTDKGCYVNLSLTIDSDEYEVIRYRGHHELGNQIVIHKNGEDLSGNTATKSNQILAELIPLTYEDLTTMVVISQSLPGKFSNLSPSGRKSALENLGNYADQVESAKTSFNDKKKSADSELDGIRSRIANSRNNIAVLERSISSLNSDLTRESQLLVEQEDKKKIHEAEVAVIDEKIANANKGLAEIQVEWDNLMNEKTPIDAELNQLREIGREANKSILSYNQETLKLISESDNHQIAIMKYKAPSPKCPTCEQEITDKDKISTLIQELEDKIISNNSRIDDLKVMRQAAEFNINLHAETIVGLESKIKEIEEKMSQISPKRNSYMSDLKTSYPKFTEIADRTESLKSRIDEETGRIKELQVSIEEDEKLIPPLESRSKILGDIVKDISRGEFRNFLLERTMNSFNEILRVISQPIMKDGFVEISMSDGSKVEILYKDRLYEQMSSGEKRRLDIAIELTKRKYKSLVTGINFNLLVLDEILDTLDSTGISAIFDAVDVSGACESFMIISHRSDISMDYSQRVRVIKEEGNSRLEVE